MGENSKIEWCHHTVNIWWGCFEVHKGCDNCYAKKLANRYHGPDLLWQQQGPRMLTLGWKKDLLRYQARAEKAGEKYYIFINSMSDFFEKSMPLVNHAHEELLVDGEPDYPLTTDEVRMYFYDVVDRCPNLIFLLLTKRPSNILKMIPYGWQTNPRPNVIFGTSIVDQQTADTLIPQLIKVPGKHFLSMEPLVGPVDITQAKINYSVPTRYEDGIGIEWTDPGNAFIGVDWVIVGGESGPGARPMNSAWVRSLRDQCKRTNVPFFLKQWGEWLPLTPPMGHMGISKSDDGTNRMFHYEQNKNSHKFLRCNDQTFYHVGKADAGSLLDGENHKVFPI